MKDLLIIATTTLLLVAIWIGTEAHKVTKQRVIADELLEIATPFNGRIDVVYLNSLRELETPANE